MISIKQRKHENCQVSCVMTLGTMRDAKRETSTRIPNQLSNDFSSFLKSQLAQWTRAHWNGKPKAVKRVDYWMHPHWQGNPSWSKEAKLIIGCIHIGEENQRQSRKDKANHWVHSHWQGRSRVSELGFLGALMLVRKKPEIIKRRTKLFIECIRIP